MTDRLYKIYKNMRQRQQKFSAWLCAQQGVMPPSALRYTLSALVPYTKANLELAFRPTQFFKELEKIDNAMYSQTSIKQAYYEAKRKQLIVINDDGSLLLSRQALGSIKPFIPKKLKGASVMVIFDIPEIESYKRRWLRLLLRELKFVQVQKSVWMSEYDCFEILSAGILEQQLEKYTRIFEARAIEM